MNSQVVKQIISGWIGQECSEELILLDAVWDRLVDDRVLRSPTSDDKDLRLRDLGLPFAAEHPPLVAPYAIVTAAAVLEEVLESARRPSLVQVRDAIRQCALAYGAPTHIAERLSGMAPRVLAAVLNEPVSGDEAGADYAKTVDVPAHSVYLRWAERGEDIQDDIVSCAKAATFLEQKTAFQIVIHETERWIQIQPQERRSISDLSNMDRGMLWLALVHRGDSLEYLTIQRRFNLEPKGSNTDAYRHRLHQYPNRLRKLLGPRLASHVIPKQRQGRWYISRDWSYCWVRRSVESERSDLVYALTTRP